MKLTVSISLILNLRKINKKMNDGYLTEHDKLVNSLNILSLLVDLDKANQQVMLETDSRIRTLMLTNNCTDLMTNIFICAA